MKNHSNVDTRGRLHLNANDARQLYPAKKRNNNADLFNNKNHDIFTNGYEQRDVIDREYGTIQQMPANQAVRQSSEGPYRANPEYGQSPLVHKYSYDGTRSPPRTKNKIGALYNPNSVDPRRVQVDPSYDQIAGVATNYGLPSNHSAAVSTNKIQKIGSPYIGGAN